jgi:hypothetical protein
MDGVRAAADFRVKLRNPGQSEHDSGVKPNSVTGDSEQDSGLKANSIPAGSRTVLG